MRRAFRRQPERLAGGGRRDPRIRLHWTASDKSAVLSADEADPAELLAASWPSRAEIEALPLAEFGDCNVTVSDYEATIERRRNDPNFWHLSLLNRDTTIT